MLEFRVAVRLLLVLVLTAPVGGLLASDAPCRDHLKYGTPGSHKQTLCRKGYVAGYNSERKTADWVAEYLTAERVLSVTTNRSNDFRPDPEIAPGQRAELVDYKGSGFDRGHLVPAGDVRWDKDAMSESFLLSNIAPQVGAGFNRGIWKSLEDRVRAWASQRVEVYVYTGPIYAQKAEARTIGPNRVAVPTHFYKVIFDPVTVEALAFVLPNKRIAGRDLKSYIVSVDEVEALTKLDFLSVVEERVQAVVEGKKPAEIWE